MALSNWTVHQIGLLVFLLFPLSIALWNSIIFRRLGDYGVAPPLPRVSVLVPARNEELNIGPCLRSLLGQEYPDFQVIALDDNSTDGTWGILEDLVARDNRLTILKGIRYPRAGWASTGRVTNCPASLMAN